MRWAPLLCVLGACSASPRDQDAELRTEFMRTYLASQEGLFAFHLVLDPEIRLESGFCGLEMKRADGKFVRGHRRMARQGILRVKGGRARKLSLRGNAPHDPLHGPPVLEVHVDGELVDSFVVNWDFSRDLVLSPSRGEWRTVTLFLTGYTHYPGTACETGPLFLQDIFLSEG